MIIDELVVGGVTLKNVVCSVKGDTIEYVVPDVICVCSEGDTFQQVTIEGGATEPISKEDLKVAVEEHFEKWGPL